MSTIAFVSCVKTKADRPMPAKDLYTSPWFKLARRYAERNADYWFILSAEHGLVDPKTIIVPYEKTLGAMGVAGRKAWAEKVIDQIKALDVRGDRALVLAGINYRLDLMPFLHLQFRKVDVPMRGLTQGQQLSWLKDSTRNPD